MKIRLNITIALISIVIICSGLLFAFRHRVVLFQFHESGDAQEDPVFVLFNPFRDRDPEHTAEHFIEELSSSRCLELVVPLRGSYASNICDHEQQYISKRVHLSNRKEGEGLIDLAFVIDRKDSPPSNAKVSVKRDIQGWKVTDYEPIY